jgi:hypothetical protein
MHNEARIKMALEAIKNRYFRPVMARQEGLLVHHGDCHIHQSKEDCGMCPCTCGLLHDLQWLPTSVIDKIYPKFQDDQSKSLTTWEQEQEINDRPPDYEGLQGLLDQVFGPQPEVTQEEWDAYYEEQKYDWRVIESVFGKEYVQYLIENGPKD